MLTESHDPAKCESMDDIEKKNTSTFKISKSTVRQQSNFVSNNAEREISLHDDFP